MLPQSTTTIEDFIESGNGTTISYFNLSFIDKLTNGTWVSILNTVSSYMEELLDVAINVELTVDQQMIYYYKPKLLCYDIYGNPELYFIILLLNDMADVKEFCKPIIKMLKKGHMNTLISNIYNVEKESLNSYNKKNTGQ